MISISISILVLIFSNCSVFQLDEWVLCRIYKKNSSCQKPAAIISSREYSHGSPPSSSSSHIDDVMESLPEISDDFFAYPKTLQQNDIKFNFQIPADSVNSDWASLAGLYSVPELAPLNQPPPPSGTNFNYNNNNADLYVPSISPPFFQVDLPPAKKVQSDDPYGFRYPAQHRDGGVYGFSQ